jgi:hypothetical protein
MSSISLEALDVNLRGRYTQWILPSADACALPRGFQDQILSGSQAFQTQILLLSKTDSKAWYLCYPWDMTFIPETPTDWSLILSVIQHLKKPVLIITTPNCHAPDAFWAKLLAFPAPTPTCCSLVALGAHSAGTLLTAPHTIFFPSLQDLSEEDFLKGAQWILPAAKQCIQSLDLRTLYRELRGAGASLCLSQMDARHIPGSISQFSAMWFYPEINGALRLHLSDLRSILRTVTERLTDV